MSFLTKVIKFHVLSFLVALAIFYAPFANDIKFTEYEIASQPTYSEGQITLNNAEKLFEGKIRGPECFAIFKGELYISAHGGWVYKIEQDKLVKVVQTGQDCGNQWYEDEKCGRPLGLKFDESGNLFIIDTYYGIFMANMSTGKFDGNLVKLVSLDTPIDGRKPKLPNSLDISKDGTIYWTDSSSTHQLHDGFLAILPDGDGRLIKLNKKTGKNIVLLDNILFANGVALSKDESFIVVAETGLFRVHKYYLKGPKAGTSEIFLENLPGYPDNIRLNKDGDIVISLIFPFKPRTHLGSIIRPFPNVRKLIYKVVKLFDLLFIYLNEVYPNDIFAHIQHWIGHFESANSISSKNIKIFIANNNGKVLKIHNGNDGKVSGICDLIELNGYYYLASPFNNFLGRVKVN